jgi:hypothetical protein
MSAAKLDHDVSGSIRLWPADQVERWPIERLTPYANNARLHSEADLDKITASIRQWGWTMPVLADEDGVLIAGHARVRAAAKLGLTSIPVIVARGWSEEEKRAYRVADNQLAARGSWDPEQLSKELGDLKFDKFDLGLIGFEPDQLDKILGGLGPNGRSDPDSVPELLEQPVTRLGDVWCLGDHRVGCGDSTSAADVARVLSASKPHLMVTDPPYGVGYDPSWRACRHQSSGNLAQGKVLNDDRRLARGLCAVPRRCRVCVVRRSARRCGGRRSRRLRVSAARSDRLGQAAFHVEPRRLSLEARNLLVCSARRQDQPLAGRPQADDRVGDPQQQSVRQWAARGAQGTARRNRSNACAGRSPTTAAPERRSTTRFSARAPASSPAK